MTGHFPRLGLLGPALALFASAASAQVKASEAASVSQTIDGTKMTIEYSRPKARGRKELFGGQVHWGEVWTPGANASTTLETNSRRFHLQRPDTTKVPIRFEVEARKGPFVPTLTWAFEDLRLSGGQLTMHWGTMGVAMDLAVQPTFELRMAEDRAAPYVGWYDLVVGPASDTTQSYRPIRGTLRIEYRNGSLRGNVATTVLYEGKEQHWSYEVLPLPNKDGSFTPGYTLKGELSSTNPGLVYEFKRTDGKVAGLEERYNDKLEGTYIRRP